MTFSYNTTAYEITKNYTLCKKAMQYYNISSLDQAEDSDDAAWKAEYTRVCLYNINKPLPTVPFNTKLPYSTPVHSNTGIVSSTPLQSATAGATPTATEAASTLSS
jgi:hypothetical protein